MILEQKKQYILDAFYQRQEIGWLQMRTIFLSIHGSTCYGLNIESSDVDFTGICMPPKDYLLGFLKNLEQLTNNKPDGCIYSIIKWFALAANANPNVLELLWIDEKYHIIAEPQFKFLQTIRQTFLSTRVKDTYTGYAKQQLGRIKTHKNWLMNPPDHKPTREEFSLSPEKTISEDQRGALNQLIENNEIKLEDNALLILQNENAYHNARKHYAQYENWLKTRNPARAALESKFGYDTKHAGHLVRLIRQGKELLTTGTMNVERKEDREELLSIRSGCWTYEQLMGWVDKNATDAEFYELAKSSGLPEQPNRNKLHDICVALVEKSL